ncbi:MAG TPA: glycerol kinase GlpK [Clostridia bacterium]|nr:glycerol kinase GlpK [Clostridia bacterium]
MKRYILALDEGTTSARCVLYDTLQNKIAHIASQEFDLIFPCAGWVEQDANTVWAAQYAALNETIAASGVKLKEIYGIGITNQRETVVLWDKKTGKPIYNAIVWQCRRTADFCDEIKKDADLVTKIQSKTGLVIDAYFSASKIKWILDNVKGARQKAKKGELLCGTIDTWIIYKLTQGKVHVTDPTNASRTMLYNINTMDWDDELLGFFDIPKNILPKVVDSDTVVGNAELLKLPLPICGIAGDQQSALFGQACFSAGCAKNTYGTGCFILMNTGNVPKISKNNLLTTVAWRVKGKTTYALEGSIFNAGSTVQWMRDKMDFFKESSESEKWAKEAKNCDGSQGTDGVYVVPAFTGLGAPYWNQDARGIIIGITRGTTKAHIIRATLESMAYSTKDVLINMEKDAELKLNSLAVDGGVSKNDFLMQFQSDILGVKLKRPISTETTVLGAVFLCGLGLGVWKNLDEISNKWQIGKDFSPLMQTEKAEKLYTDWKRAVLRCLDWAE